MPGDEEALLGLGGDDGGSAGGDDGGGVAVEEQTGDPGEGGEEGTERQDDQQQDQDAQQRRQGTKYGSKELKADVARLKEVDPALAKRFERANWKVAQVDALGPMQRITESLQAIEMHGGVEGIAELAQTAQAAIELEQGFSKGDPRVLDGWAKDFPEGFARLMSPAIEKLRTVNPERFDNIRTSLMNDGLDHYGVYSVAATIKAAIEAGKFEDAAREFAKVERFLGQVRHFGQRSKEDPYANERKELDTRAQEIEANAGKVFRNDVRAVVNTTVSAAINKQITSELGNRKLNPAIGNRLRREINSELQKAVNSDAAYAKQYEVVMARRNRDSAASFISNAASKKIPTVVKTLLKEFGLTAAGNRAAVGSRESGNGKQPVNAPVVRRALGVLTISGKPKADEVDWTRSEKSTFLLPHGTLWDKQGRKRVW
jgi:hypothetical protein